MTIRCAMVGGGPGAFIGPVHRMAAELDGRFRLVAGAFSRDAARNAAGAARFGIDPERGYGDWRSMIEVEAARRDGARAVIVATPNALHLPVVEAALNLGLHVISDKPATATLTEAHALRAAVAASPALYALTYTYTGYPMLRLARRLCEDGELGTIRKVAAEYLQGWLSAPVERDANRQAAWRTDPAQAGVGGCISDIGVHAFNLIGFVTGLRADALAARLRCAVDGRALDDDADILLSFAGGATGTLIASQVATGAVNDLSLRIWGDRAGLAWHHHQPDVLHIDRPGHRTETLRAGVDADPPSDARLPAGHPEGYLGAFATLYRDIADAIDNDDSSRRVLVPGVAEGVRDMAFVDAAVRSRGAWVDLRDAAT